MSLHDFRNAARMLYVQQELLYGYRQGKNGRVAAPAAMFKNTVSVIVCYFELSTEAHIIVKLSGEALDFYDELGPEASKRAGINNFADRLVNILQTLKRTRPDTEGLDNIIERAEHKLASEEHADGGVTTHRQIENLLHNGEYLDAATAIKNVLSNPKMRVEVRGQHLCSLIEALAGIKQYDSAKAQLDKSISFLKENAMPAELVTTPLMNCLLNHALKIVLLQDDFSTSEKEFFLHSAHTLANLEVAGHTEDSKLALLLTAMGALRKECELVAVELEAAFAALPPTPLGVTSDFGLHFIAERIGKIVGIRQRFGGAPLYLAVAWRRGVIAWRRTLTPVLTIRVDDEAFLRITCTGDSEPIRAEWHLTTEGFALVFEPNSHSRAGSTLLWVDSTDSANSTSRSQFREALMDVHSQSAVSATYIVAPDKSQTVKITSSIQFDESNESGRPRTIPLFAGWPHTRATER